MLNIENTKHYASGSDMWRDYVETYGVVFAKNIARFYLNSQPKDSSPNEQQFCKELYHAMSLALSSTHTESSETSEKAKVMTVSELANKHKRMNPNSHYFSDRTLKWFGEKLEDMHLLDDTVNIKTSTNEIRECYVLVRLQREHPDGPMRTHAYFDVETLGNVLPNPSLLGELKTGLDFWPEDKPSVLNEIRETRTSKAPTDQKTEPDKTKKKSQPEH